MRYYRPVAESDEANPVSIQFLSEWKDPSWGTVFGFRLRTYPTPGQEPQGYDDIILCLNAEGFPVSLKALRMHIQRGAPESPESLIPSRIASITMSRDSIEYEFHGKNTTVEVPAKFIDDYRSHGHFALFLIQQPLLAMVPVLCSLRDDTERSAFSGFYTGEGAEGGYRGLTATADSTNFSHYTLERKPATLIDALGKKGIKVLPFVMTVQPAQIGRPQRRRLRSQGFVVPPSNTPTVHVVLLVDHSGIVYGFEYAELRASRSYRLARIEVLPDSSTPNAQSLN